VESDQDSVDVSASDTNLVVRNNADSRIYYFAIGRDVAPLILWVPTLDRETSVSANSRKSVDLANLNLDENETAVLFYWWKATTRNGTTVPGDVNTIVVDLK
jgi:hypothetical protein